MCLNQFGNDGVLHRPLGHLGANPVLGSRPATQSANALLSSLSNVSTSSPMIDRPLVPLRTSLIVPFQSSASFSMYRTCAGCQPGPKRVMRKTSHFSFFQLFSNHLTPCRGLDCGLLGGSIGVSRKNQPFESQARKAKGLTSDIKKDGRAAEGECVLRCARFFVSTDSPFLKG